MPIYILHVSDATDTIVLFLLINCPKSVRMMAAHHISWWYRSSITNPKVSSRTLGLSFGAVRHVPQRVASFIHEWTPFLLIASYFVFSVCLYTFCTETLIEMFWFIYLTTNFYIAGSTVLEAFMSIGPCRDARKAVRKIQEKGWVFPTPDDDLLILDLLIVRISRLVFISTQSL